MLVVVKLGIFICLWLTTFDCGLLISHSRVLHLFKALGISCANEVSLHVVNTTLRVHQILLIFAFDLNHTHNNTINHVNRLSFFFLVLLLLLFRRSIISNLILVFLLIHNLHSHRVILESLVSVLLSAKLLIVSLTLMYLLIVVL